MTNPYFTKSGTPSSHSPGASSPIRAEIAAIEAGFDKLPTLSGNALKLIRINAGANGLEPIGTIDAIPIGATTPSTGAFTTLSASGGITGNLTGTVTGNVTGNATTATTLQTARNINGVAFNGSTDITVTAAASTLTGATLAAGVTASSLTSLGTLGSLSVTGGVTAASFSGSGASLTTLNASNLSSGSVALTRLTLLTDILADTTSSSNGPALIGVKSSIIGAVATTLYAFLESQVINVKTHCGAVGDGIADDSDAIELGLAMLVIIGGDTLYFPAGSYKTTRQIDIASAGLTKNSIRLLGNGRRKVYPGVFVPSSTGPATIFGVHTDRNLFRFYNTSLDVLSNFVAEEISFATLETGSTPTAAFGWECGNFHRDFTFQRCAIHGFTSAFDLYYGSGANFQMGVLKVLNCAINRNKWIARTLSGLNWNGFVFHHNDAGQNGFNSGEGGIDILAGSASICDNIMEGQRDPIKITGLFSPTVIKNNYFEDTFGFANVQIHQSRGPVDISCNFHQNAGLFVTHRVYVYKSANVKTDGPYWAEGVYKSSVSTHVLADNTTNYGLGESAAVYSSTAKLARIDDARAYTALQRGAFTTEYVIRKSGRREINPMSGRPMSAAAFSSGGTVGTNKEQFSVAITVPADSWAVLSFMIKYDTTVIDPAVSWLTMTDGTQDFQFDNASVVCVAGDWYTVMVAYRVTTLFNATCTVDFYPYGSAAAAGKTAAISAATITVVTDRSRVVPYISNEACESASAAPTTGFWGVGDAIANSAPAAGGTPGWTCVTAGTPGTWKAQANLAA
jgi:hypothetical protein